VQAVPQRLKPPHCHSCVNAGLNPAKRIHPQDAEVMSNRAWRRHHASTLAADFAGDQLTEYLNVMETTARPAPEMEASSSRTLRLLVVEDNPRDAQLITAALKRAGYPLSFDRVDLAEEYRRHLERNDYDIILSDHNLGAWLGTDALEILRQSGKDIPFVVVTATLGDEAAVEYLKQGATDYLLKQRLERLPAVVGRALSDKAHREQAARLQEQILYAKREWELTFDSVADAVILINELGHIQRANRAALEILGLKEFSQLIGKPCTEIIHGQKSEPPDCPHCVFRQSHNPERRELQEPRLGKIFDAGCTPVRDSSGAVRSSVLVLHDITARKRAEEALQKSEERFAMAFRLSPDAVCITTLHSGRYVDVNQAFLELTGYSRAEALASSAVGLGLWVEPQERAKLLEAVLEKERVQGFETQFRRRDGEVRMIERSSERVELAGETCILSVIRDVTEHKKLEEQLRQAQKMDAIGQLAGGIAHDFNNLLGVIIGHGELLLERDDLAPAPRKKVEQINEAAERAADLTRQLLAFSRKQILEPRSLNLNSVVSQAETMLHRLIGENIELLTRLEPALGTIKADPGQLTQVIMNLAVNARDAMPKNGTLTIETANVEVDESYSRQHVNAPPGPYVLLSVSDNGCGMDEATRARVFEPFFTTKEPGKGTGLGLSMAYGIVNQSGGFIWVYSEPGRGTTFKIYLPHIDETVVPEIRATPTIAIPRGSESVLVAEDEPGLRELLAEVLEQNGYNVLLASNAEAALHAAGKAQKIDLVVTDVIMPGASGVELVRQLRTSRPDIRVLYLSGYTNDAIGRHGVLEPGTPFLAKPFRPADLARKVREVLDQERGIGP